MHRYRIVAQISLILPILNLVLATPIVVQETHEARGDEMVAADDMTMPKDSELEATLDRLTSPHPSPDAMASAQHSSLSDRLTSPSPSPDTMAFPQHSLLSDRLMSPPSSPDAMTSPQHSSLWDGSTSSGYSSPYLSSDSSVSGYSWLLDRPPRLSPNRPASLHGSASPHSSSSGLSEIQLPEWVYELGWEIPPPPHPSLASSGSSTISLPGWWHELALGSDRATTESYSPSDRFTPSHHPSSLSTTDTFSWHSDGPMSTPYLSASGGSPSSQYFSASDGLAPSRNSISEGSQSSPSPPPNEGPLGNAKFLNKDMIKKLKIVAGVVIIGGVIASIAGSQIKHRDCQDS